jgi:hypothetical protein
MTLLGVKDCEKSEHLFPQLRKASLASYRCKNAFFQAFLMKKPRFKPNIFMEAFPSSGNILTDFSHLISLIF